MATLLKRKTRFAKRRMPASPSRTLLDHTPPTRLFQEIIARVEQLIVQHQEHESQGRLPNTSPSATVPDYSQCLVILNALALRSRSPIKYPNPLKMQEHLYHRLLSIEIEARYLYGELESNHLRTNSKSSKQQSYEELHTLRATYRNRWLLELEGMLADCDMFHLAGDEHKTQHQLKTA